jgi:hypothetical protein
MSISRFCKILFVHLINLKVLLGMQIKEPLTTAFLYNLKSTSNSFLKLKKQ